MSQALKDSNSVSSLLAVLNTDPIQGMNLVRIAVDPVTHGMLIDETSTISFTMTPVDPRDLNSVPVWLFQGSDGLTYPAVATSTGALLVNTH